jgi:hypothetical protein
VAKRDPFKELNGMISAVEGVVDSLRPLVAGLKADGYTDREARMIVAGLFGPKNDPENEWKDPDA